MGGGMSDPGDARVEAAARAIYGPWADGLMRWEDLLPDEREIWLVQARAALAAADQAAGVAGPEAVRVDESWADTLPPCRLCGEDVPWADALLMPCGTEDEVAHAGLIHGGGCAAEPVLGTGVAGPDSERPKPLPDRLTDSRVQHGWDAGQSAAEEFLRDETTVLAATDAVCRFDPDAAEYRARAAAWVRVALNTAADWLVLDDL